MQQPLNRFLLLQPVWLPTVLFIPLLYALGWLAAVPLTLLGLPPDQLSLTGTVLSFVLFLLLMPRWAALRWSSDNPWVNLGVRSSGTDDRPTAAFAALKGLLIAAGLLVLITSIVLIGGWGQWVGHLEATAFFNAILLCLGVGFAEELIFRGWLWKELNNIIGSRYGAVAQSGIFSLVHTRFNLGLEAMSGLLAGLFLLGLVLSRQRQTDKGSLWGSIGTHGGLVGGWFLLQNNFLQLAPQSPAWLLGPGEGQINPLGGAVAITSLTFLLIKYKATNSSLKPNSKNLFQALEGHSKRIRLICEEASGQRHFHNIQTAPPPSHNHNGSKKAIVAYYFYKILIAINPRNYRLHIKGAKRLKKLGQSRKSLEFINKLEANSQGNKRLLSTIRNHYRRAGAREQSLRVSKQLAALEPSDKELTRELTSDLITLNQVKKGIEIGIKSHLITERQALGGISALIDPATAVLTSDARQCLQTLKVFPHFDDENFNCKLDKLINSAIPTVCVIHVGKCAGGSTINALSNTFDKSRTRLIEYHIFDTNHVLKQVIPQTTQLEHIHWVILTRDPVSRWISSFNWDYYTYAVKKRFYCHPKALKLFKNFNNCLTLAREIAKGNEQAVLLSRFNHLTYGHMAMGQAWYLNRNLIESLSPSRTSLIRTENIANDLRTGIAKINTHFGWSKAFKNEPITDKNDYQKQYEPGKFKKIGDFNPGEVEGLRKHLDDDFYIHDLLIQRFAFE